MSFLTFSDCFSLIFLLGFFRIFVPPLIKYLKIHSKNDYFISSTIFFEYFLHDVIYKITIRINNKDRNHFPLKIANKVTIMNNADEVLDTAYSL